MAAGRKVSASRERTPIPGDHCCVKTVVTTEIPRSGLVQLRLWKRFHSRKNSLFYKTRKGAQMGDLFMSLIHTCELNEINAFDYLTELLRHIEELKQHPSEWMPWNYRDTLARRSTSEAA